MAERTGNCNRCGRCCQSRYLYESAGIIGKIIIRLNIFFAGGKFNINNKCGYLRMQGKEAVCKNYKNRPQFCRDYPVTKGDLISGCGYKIE